MQLRLPERGSASADEPFSRDLRLRPRVPLRRGRASLPLPGVSEEQDERARVNEKAGQRPAFSRRIAPAVSGYSGLTFAAAGPFWPWVTSKDTFWPSLSDL